MFMMIIVLVTNDQEKIEAVETALSELKLQNSDKSRIILEYKLKGIVMEYFTFI